MKIGQRRWQQNRERTGGVPVSPVSGVPKMLRSAFEDMRDDFGEAGGRASLEQFERIEPGLAVDVGRKIDAPRAGMKRYGAHQADEGPGDADLAGRFPRLGAARG